MSDTIQRWWPLSGCTRSIPEMDAAYRDKCLAALAQDNEIERLRRLIDEGNATFATWKANYDQLERELAETQDQRSSLLATNYDLRKERDRMTDELDEARGLLREARGRLPPRNAYLREPSLEDLRSRIDAFLAADRETSAHE